MLPKLPSPLSALCFHFCLKAMVRRAGGGQRERARGGKKASEGNREKAIEKGRSLELFDKRHLHKASPGSRAAVVNKKTASTSPSCRSAGFTLIKDWKGAHLRAPKSLTPPITTRFP